MSITLEKKKQEIIKKYARDEGDTGSPEGASSYTY